MGKVLGIGKRLGRGDSLHLRVSVLSLFIPCVFNEVLLLGLLNPRLTFACDNRPIIIYCACVTILPPPS